MRSYSSSLELTYTVSGSFSVFSPSVLNYGIQLSCPTTSSEESGTKKSKKTVTSEKKMEVLYCYARGKKTSVILHDCPYNGTKVEHILHHQCRF
ncbi:hypothetical protein E2C01_054932 [Portunus trituberculatus]|uniref:Uncharacterized protein n=1 Tax=Portunus trituberculatus TaxID=210409 RepID=A0A5B7GTD3_PORTR|nr:hypothetical protein [Portunus trituberculatus]